MGTFEIIQENRLLIALVGFVLMIMIPELIPLAILGLIVLAYLRHKKNKEKNRETDN